MGALCCAPSDDQMQSQELTSIQVLPSFPLEDDGVVSVPDHKKIDALCRALKDPLSVEHMANEHLAGSEFQNRLVNAEEVDVNYSSKKLKVRLETRKEHDGLDYEYLFINAPYPFSSDLFALLGINATEEFEKAIDENLESYEVFDTWRMKDCLVSVTKSRTIKTKSIRAIENVLVRVFRRDEDQVSVTSFVDVTKTGLIDLIKYKTLMDLSECSEVSSFGLVKVENGSISISKKHTVPPSLEKPSQAYTSKDEARTYVELLVLESARMIMTSDVKKMRWIESEENRVNEILLENLKILSEMKIPGLKISIDQIKRREKALFESQTDLELKEKLSQPVTSLSSKEFHLPTDESKIEIGQIRNKANSIDLPEGIVSITHKLADVKLNKPKTEPVDPNVIDQTPKTTSTKEENDSSTMASEQQASGDAESENQVENDLK